MTIKHLICSTDQFEELLKLIQADGFTTYGPTIQNEVIVYDELQSAQDLPIGWMDEQDPGYYRLKRRDDQAYFGTLFLTKKSQMKYHSSNF